MTTIRRYPTLASSVIVAAAFAIAEAIGSHGTERHARPRLSPSRAGANSFGPFCLAGEGAAGCASSGSPSFTACRAARRPLAGAYPHQSRLRMTVR